MYICEIKATKYKYNKYNNNIIVYLQNILKMIDLNRGETMPNNNSKADNFVRLAEARTNKIIDMISLLGNLSNKSNYIYTDEQVESIFSSIQEALNESRKKFTEEPIKKKKKFRL